jgi:hypothetical protein
MIVLSSVKEIGQQEGTPPPSSHNTVRTVPYMAVHKALLKRLKWSARETNLRLSKKDFRNASFMCEAPEFHQGPRPFRADFQALNSDNPPRIKFLPRVKGRSH